MTHTRFIQRSTEAVSYEGMPDWFSSLLAARGIRTRDEADRFLNPSLSDLHDPFLLDGMQQTVDLLKAAIAEGKTILVYGDYDADGVCAASIREFALPIIVGILSGVYSANMINGYVWAFLEEKRRSRKAKA